jgi:hypothetical protein
VVLGQTPDVGVNRFGVVQVTADHLHHGFAALGERFAQSETPRCTNSRVSPVVALPEAPTSPGALQSAENQAAGPATRNSVRLGSCRLPSPRARSTDFELSAGVLAAGPGQESYSHRTRSSRQTPAACAAPAGGSRRPSSSLPQSARCRRPRTWGKSARSQCVSEFCTQGLAIRLGMGIGRRVSEGGGQRGLRVTSSGTVVPRTCLPSRRQ